ncbi:YMGG-like glycine zipper-containing protein [Hymenobacter terrenus]|uniref:YMGG-like glycine zipper-containing protein n=1 Tax=Hymenobacter terrenus TaxID=1629124 RepID=UPI00061907A3|nr:YMGG-like glycine zipper-containing protein [Hymenobacter terrenus]
MNKLPYIFSLIVLLSTMLTATPSQAQERRGWSPQAKGAVIGGGSGAILGAVINKRNRAVGGVVGGVVGAGAGYAIGKHTDNKRKEAARIAAANRAAAAREAEYRRALARREAVAAKTQAAAVPANSLAASNAMVSGSAQPAISNAAYLPNDSYGDASKPYSNSEYRHKSW